MNKEGEIILEVKGLSKRYQIRSSGGNKRNFRDVLRNFYRGDFFLKNETKRDFWALKGIDLSVRRGDRLIIFGKNGAGKSTFLKIISGITVPSGGEFHLKVRFNSLLQAGSGFHDELTGIENIYLSGSLMNIPKKVIKERIPAIVAFAELENFIYNPVKTYSSGMLSRLGFSVAIHNIEADLIILDEIFATGDAGFRERSLKRMREILFNSKKAVIYVGHENSVSDFFNRGVVFDKGMKIYDGNVQDAHKLYLENVRS